jgi:RNA-directed DNA polymerase
MANHSENGGTYMSAANLLWTDEELIPSREGLLDRMMDRQNIEKAALHVIQNNGSAGIDRMTVKELPAWLKCNFAQLQKAVLTGSYRPSAVKLKEISKPGGGKRQLGIPTVTDRMLQQALHQVMNPFFDPFFSEHSFGFRRGRSTHQAVILARNFQREGKRYVVDVDLSKFFDRVNHDVLIALIKRRITDRGILRLVDLYLRSGIMTEGVIIPRDEGTPQGSPLSPLLSNIMLNELDNELEKRGHSFCRYADDFSIYVSSQKSGERVLESITHFIETELKLKVNQDKSAVDKGYRRVFLGYGFTSEKQTRLRAPKERILRFKKKMKEEFRRGRGKQMERFIREELNPKIRGWANYYNLSETITFAKALDKWIRRRLRLIKWRQWKRPRTRIKYLRKAGCSMEHAVMSACNNRGC